MQHYKVVAVDAMGVKGVMHKANDEVKVEMERHWLVLCVMEFMASRYVCVYIYILTHMHKYLT